MRDEGSGHGPEGSGGVTGDEDEQEGRGFEVVDFALAGLDHTLRQGSYQKGGSEAEQDMVWAHKGRSATVRDRQAIIEKRKV